MNKLFLFSTLFLLFSCKAKVPEDVIGKSTMVDLLYDYHLAQAMAKSQSDSVDFRTKLYTQAVFDKYEVNEERFNRSMEWYTRNSEELFKIYKQIDQKFEEAGATVTVQGNRYAAMTAPGDTMNIWQGRDFYLLNSQATNRLEFSQQSDTTYRSGDRLMWQFETEWYYHEGQKSAMAHLSLVYDNDSVVSTMQNLYSAGKQEIYISAGDRPVKMVQGSIYLVSPWSNLPKILTISNPVLVKFRRQEALKIKDILPENTLQSNNGTLKQVEDTMVVGTAENNPQLQREYIRPEDDEKKKVENVGPVRMLQLPK